MRRPWSCSGRGRVPRRRHCGDAAAAERRSRTVRDRASGIGPDDTGKPSPGARACTPCCARAAHTRGYMQRTAPDATAADRMARGLVTGWHLPGGGRYERLCLCPSTAKAAMSATPAPPLAHEADALLQRLGVPRAAYTGGDLPVRSPITGETLGAVPQSTPAQAAAAIGRAQAAFLEWR